MKVKRIKRVGSFLCVLTLLVGMVFPHMTSKASNGIEYFGKINYLGTIVGHFNINGQIAFCFEHEKPTPPTGTAFGEEIYHDENLKKVLYYGYEGIEPWSGFGSTEQGIVLTSLAGSYYYSGAGSIGFAFGGSYSDSIGLTQFIQYIESQTIPSTALSISKQDLESYVESNLQRTENITLNADSKNKVTIPLEADVTLHNMTTGESVTGVNAVVKGGDTFCFTAPLQKNNNWSSGDMLGSLGKFNAVLAKTSPAIQDLGRYNWATDPEKKVQLNIKWKGLGKIKLQKVDTETDKTTPQGSGSLAGAVYEVLDGATVVDTLTTDANGEAISKDLIMKQYKVKEKSASTGYLVDATSYDVNLNALEVKMKSKEQIIRGGIEVEKWDFETDKNIPQGNATFDKTTFEIVNKNTKAVMVEGKSYNTGEVVKEIVSDEKGIAKTTNKILPFGDYDIREKTPPLGYKNIGVTSRSFKITEDGVIVKLNTTDTAIKNVPIRGDLEFVKIEDGTGKRMQNIPFSITSKTTGESHTILTDKNGYASTLSSWNPHKQNTNKGESSKDGIWFGNSDVISEDVGALLYDTYIVDELRCEANKGKILLTGIEVTIERDLTTIKLGTLTNDEEPVPKIGTKARDGETGKQEVLNKKEITIIDEVSYENLIVGKEYTLKGILMDKATGKPLLVDGKEVVSEKKFIPKEKNGTVEISFTFNASTLAGKDIVVFEKVFDKEVEVTSHEDIEDVGQTIKVREPEKEPEKEPVVSKTEPPKTEPPKTGDNENSALYGMICVLLSFGGIGILLKKRRDITKILEKFENKDLPPSKVSKP